jgi:hypothetical protein
MKIRDFDIENYDYHAYLISLIEAELPTVVLGIELKSVRVRSKEIDEADWNDKGEIKRKQLENFPKKAEVIAHFKAKYNESKKTTVQKFNETKAYVDKILSDDKEYIDLCEVLEGNYYCQATAMLKDILNKKTRGNSVKAMKYQARKMQADDVSCD